MSHARRPKIVRELDFNRPSKFSREVVRQLEHAHSNFCQTASSRLSAELRADAELKWTLADQLPYSKVMREEIPDNSLVATVLIEELQTEILLSFDPDMCATAVNRLLGGEGIGASRNGGLSDLDISVFRCAVITLIESLTDVWKDAAGVTLKLETLEVGTTSVQIAPLAEPTLNITLQMTLEGEESIMNIVLPHRSVETVLVQFEMGQYGRGDSRADSASLSKIGSAIAPVPLPVTVEAGRSTMTISEVLALKPGDDVRIRKPGSDGGLIVYLSDRPAWEARGGRHDGRLAVQLSRRVKEPS